MGTIDWKEKRPLDVSDWRLLVRATLNDQFPSAEPARSYARSMCGLFLVVHGASCGDLPKHILYDPHFSPGIGRVDFSAFVSGQLEKCSALVCVPPWAPQTPGEGHRGCWMPHIAERLLITLS